MKRIAVILVAALVATTAVAGCLGSDDAPDADTSSNPSPSEDQDDAGNETATPEANETATEVQKDSVEGTIRGAGANGCLLNASPLSDQPAEFTVPQDTKKLQVNLTLDGTGEICATLYTPSQDVSEEGEGEMTTSDQQASWSTDKPEAGTWSVYLYGAGTGPVDGTYVLDLTHHVLVDGASPAS